MAQELDNRNPANVPKVRDVRWSYAPKEASTRAQQEKLRELLTWENIQPITLFGDGFTSIEDLSKWSAHWGITTLEDWELARNIEAARREVEERLEQETKTAIADFYRAKHPHLRRRYA